MPKIHLIVIDPQNDFCDPKGSLFVPGADKDMDRLSAMIKRLGSKIDEISVTLDSHRTVDIAHPIYWKDSKGNPPNPFTIISADDVKNGVWSTRHPGLTQWGIEYTESLAKQGKYALCIWPEHCIIGSKGASVYPSLSEALIEWEKDNFALVDYVPKGSNLNTEHYSAVKAEVVDPNDQLNTGLNTNFIQSTMSADIILLAGEAKSHCLKSTVDDMADNFGTDNIKKMVLLTDCTSSVISPFVDFEKISEDWQRDMVAKGMQISTSVDFLK